MSVKLSGPTSEIEAAAKKKHITEKELKEIISSSPSRQILNSTKAKLQELLSFYDRIIASINSSINSIGKKRQLTHTQKKDLYLDNHEKDLAQSKKEKMKFRRYLQQINSMIDENK